MLWEFQESNQSYCLKVVFLSLNQCFVSVLMSIQIRIQHFRSIRIRIRIRVQVFSWQKWKNNFCQIFYTYFLLTNCYEELDLGPPGSSENHQAFIKMVNSLFNFSTSFWLPWIWIRNAYSQHGSGSSDAISRRIHEDPDRKHWFKLPFYQGGCRPQRSVRPSRVRERRRPPLFLPVRVRSC